MYMYYTFDIIPHQGTFINNIIWERYGFMGKYGSLVL